MQTVKCHSCDREFVIHKDDVEKRRVIGLVTPTNKCFIKTVKCKCGVENSVKEEK